MAAKGKIEMYATKALMKKHENSEGKKMVAMEKKDGRKGCSWQSQDIYEGQVCW